MLLIMQMVLPFRARHRDVFGREIQQAVAQISGTRSGRRDWHELMRPTRIKVIGGLRRSVGLKLMVMMMIIILLDIDPRIPGKTWVQIQNLQVLIQILLQRPLLLKKTATKLVFFFINSQPASENKYLHVESKILAKRMA